MGQTTRRAVLAGATGVGAAGVLAACGGGNENAGGNQPGNGNAGDGNANLDGSLAKTADIPVGGGKVFENQRIVVTQPTAGNFKAFTAVCTHRGCTVSSVANGTISCPCHGSEYSAADGSVKIGPALRALAAKNIEVEGDTIKLA